MNAKTTAKALHLLRQYDQVMRELRALGVTRSANNPVADFAEYLFCQAFGWEITPKSTKGHDAKDTAGNRFEIKARRLTQENGSRQLSAIRDLQGKHFDFLAGVLFNQDFTIFRAALVPWNVTVRRSSHVETTNSAKFILKDDVWETNGVKDVTRFLQDFLDGCSSEQ